MGVGVVNMTTGVVTVTTPGVVNMTTRTSESLTSEGTLREGVVIVTTGKEEKEGGLPRRQEEKKAKPSEDLLPSPSSIPASEC
jgi:hypothetical protein